jgi:hypothetical protein
MFCGECGAQVNASDLVCSACGAKVQPQRGALSISALRKPGFGVLTVTRTVLVALSQGKVIRSSIATVMQIGAVLVLLLALLALVAMLRISFQLPSAAATVGGIIVAALLAVALFAVAQIYLFRAQSVRELADSPFTIVPILSILLRAAGETYAVIALSFGIGGCLFTWLSGMNPTNLASGLGTLVPSLPGSGEGGGSFLDGLIFLVGLWLAAVLALIVFYALAEMIVVGVDIALNVRKIQNRESGVAFSAGR